MSASGHRPGLGAAFPGTAPPVGVPSPPVQTQPRAVSSLPLNLAAGQRSTVLSVPSVCRALRPPKALTAVACWEGAETSLFCCIATRPPAHHPHPCALYQSSGVDTRLADGTPSPHAHACAHAKGHLSLSSPGDGCLTSSPSLTPRPCRAAPTAPAHTSLLGVNPKPHSFMLPRS